MAIENWTIDIVHSSINFWVRHLMVSKVHGRFAKWSGRLAFDEQKPESSSLEVEIDAASIDTRDTPRDTHLRSADFFDVEYAGRSKHAYLGERIGFSARGVLNRREWGLVWNQTLDTGGLALSDKIELQLEIQATKPAPAA